MPRFERRHPSAVLLIWLLLSGIACAGDWPQWRGPHGDGFAEGEQLADTWPNAGPPLLWTRDIGAGYSAFVVVNGRAYTQTQSLYEQSLICLDAATGETIWSYRYGWPYDGGGLYPGPRATPTVVDGRVYFAAPSGELGCVDAATGQRIWSANPKEQYRGRGTDFGVSASPVIWRGKLIVPVGGPEASLVALDAKTGEVIWTCGTLPASYATPIVVPFQDRWLVVAPLENSLLCADAETGQHLWELDLSEGYDEHSAAPLYREPYLFLAGPFRSGGKCYRLIAEPDPPGCRAERVWDTLKMSNDIASSVLIGDQIYGFDLKDAQSRMNRPSRGEFRCLDWSAGTVRWSTPDLGHANLVVADDKLLVFNDRGELQLCRVSADGCETLASTSVFPDEVCWTHQALSDGRVLLRTQTRAACLYIGRQPLTAEQPILTVAEIPQGRRFDPTVLLGGEREYPATTPEWKELWQWYVWTLAGIGISWGVWLIFGRVAAFINAGPATIDGPRPTASRLSVVASCAYWIVLLSCGAAGSLWLNRGAEEFIFTWPLTLWGLLQLAVETSLWAVRQSGKRRPGWYARGAILLFVAGCGLYFHLCRMLGVAIEWAFLTGFIASYPAAILGAKLQQRAGRFASWLQLPVHVASYSCYFWGCVLFMKWWLRVGS